MSDSPDQTEKPVEKTLEEIYADTEEAERRIRKYERLTAEAETRSAIALAAHKLTKGRPSMRSQIAGLSGEEVISRLTEEMRRNQNGADS